VIDGEKVGMDVLVAVCASVSVGARVMVCVRVEVFVGVEQ